MMQTDPTNENEQTNRSFMKHFHKFHVTAVIFALGIVAVQFFYSSYLADAGEMTVQALTTCTNAIRLKHLDTTLYINPKLTLAAENKLKDMQKYGYWAHENPDTGKKPWDFVDEAGYYYETAGENLAIGFDNSQDICDAWEKSPKHFENIVNRSYQEIGFAIDKANLHKNTKGILVVLMFGSREDFKGPVQSENSETVTHSTQQGLPQVKGAETVKTDQEEKQTSGEKLKNNILFVIGFSLFFWISVLIYAKISRSKFLKKPPGKHMSMTKKIVFAVLLATVIGIVVLNVNLDQITKFLQNPTNNIQTSVVGSNPENDSATQSVQGIVDVDDVQNSSVTRSGQR